MSQVDVKRRSRVNGSRRRAVTLIEILLVLTILVLVAASAWPSLERSMADQRLRDAADMVRAEWQHARAEAMSSGVAYQFCYTPEDRTYWIEPCEDLAGSADGSTSIAAGGSSGTTSAADRRQLPETITFAGGHVDRESTETTAADEASSSKDTPLQASGNGESNVPVVFSPDGTCSSAQVTLRNENDRSVTLSIHGLTAIAVVGEVASAEEASL